LETLRRNLRHATRALLRAPAFSLTVIVTLALGIGANSAVFSAINAVLLKPLPFPEAGQLVRLRQTLAEGEGNNIAPVRLREWSERNSTFQSMTGYLTQDVADTSGDLPERLRQASVASQFLDVWRVAPALGRGFAPADHEPGAAPVALISDRYWQRRFRSDPSVVGTAIRVGADTFTLVGVLPASFTYPDPTVDVWIPIVYFPYVLQRGSWWLQGYGRLRPGVTVEQAQSDLTVIQAQLGEQFPEQDRNVRVAVSAFKESIVGSARGSLWLVFGAVSVLLLIACTNIAAMLLSRAAQREQEVAVRLALGASRSAIAFRVLTETAVLAVIGAGLGLVLAVGASGALRAFAVGLPRIDELAVDWSIVLYTLAAIVAVTLLCGLAPALRSARSVATARVAQAGRAQVSTRHSLQWLFVGVQVSLSIALLAGAGLLMRSFEELSRVDTGFDANGVLTFRVSGSYGEEFDRMIQGIEGMLDAIRTVPGVESAGTSSPVPGVLNDRSGFQFGAGQFRVVEGGGEVGADAVAEVRVVSAGYFDALQVPLAAGEECRPQRGVAASARVNEVVVNQTFVNRYLRERQAVGLNLANGAGTMRIVGVAADARDFGLAREPVATVYTCTTAVAYPPLAFLARTSGDPTALVGAIRQGLKEVEPTRSVYDVQTLEDRMGGEHVQDRLRTLLLVLFGGASLALVCLGIYGTLSYVVSLRRREVGLRVALGAQQANIVGQFLRKAMRVVALACIAGLALSFLFGRALSGMLFGISPSDPVTFSAVLVVVMGVAALAAFLPAFRASRIDPMEALRDE
jgi:putative ABC transport system permease protein